MSGGVFHRSQITDASGEPRKACPRCRNVKSITEFHRKYADDPMSSQTYCRKCHGDMKKEKGGVRCRALHPDTVAHLTWLVLCLQCTACQDGRRCEWQLVLKSRVGQVVLQLQPCAPTRQLRLRDLSC